MSLTRINKFLPALIIAVPLLTVAAFSSAQGGLFGLANAGYGGYGGYGGQNGPYKESFAAQIDAPQEVPPTTSVATGNAIFNVSLDEREIDYAVSLQNEANVTDLNLYCAPRGSNGPMVASLYHSATPVSTTDFFGTLTEADLVAAAKACNPNIDNMNHFVQAMREGSIYINVLTTAFANGEIRGQLMGTATTPGGNGGNGGQGGNNGGGSTTGATLVPMTMTVTPGQHVDFNGRDFPHETDILVTNNGAVAGHAHADGGGNFTTGSMVMPMTPGVYTFVFSGGGVSLTSMITVQ
jgi:hypothetical protein